MVKNSCTCPEPKETIQEEIITKIIQEDFEIIRDTHDLRYLPIL